MGGAGPAAQHKQALVQGHGVERSCLLAGPAVDAATAQTLSDGQLLRVAVLVCVDTVGTRWRGEAAPSLAQSPTIFALPTPCPGTLASFGSPSTGWALMGSGLDRAGLGARQAGRVCPPAPETHRYLQGEMERSWVSAWSTCWGFSVGHCVLAKGTSCGFLGLAASRLGTRATGRACSHLALRASRCGGTWPWGSSSAE